jgi:tRNA nucleotidyltransferase/poly(A) polymerase
MMKIYLVGGAVRDELMGVKSDDRDYVVVGASSEDMLALGYKQVGADFPVFLDDEGNQFALARKERKTGQGYLGFSTETGREVTLADDLLRRDLTINAIAKDTETGEYIDPYDGIQHIHDCRLQHVSPAFSEDPLRVIRLARFLSRWPHFCIAQETLDLCRQIVSSYELNHLADERIWSETEKMFKQAVDPHLFFSALELFDVFKCSYPQKVWNCEFYQDLLGFTIGKQDPSIFQMAIDATKRFDDPAEKMMVFVALASTLPDLSSQAVPSRVTKLCRNIEYVQSMRDPDLMPFDAQTILSLFLNNRAFNTDNMVMNDLIKTMSAAEGVGFKFPIEAQQLWTALSHARDVRADKFLHLKGAEIGRAMNDARLARIQVVLGIK